MYKIILPRINDLYAGYSLEVSITQTPRDIYDHPGTKICTVYTSGVYQFSVLIREDYEKGWTVFLKMPIPPPLLKSSGNDKDVSDMVNHPPHYTSSKAQCENCKESIECIEITRHMSFNIGNAVKYLWRHELKGGLEDLKKAKWYINDAIKQLDKKE